MHTHPLLIIGKDGLDKRHAGVGEDDLHRQTDKSNDHQKPTGESGEIQSPRLCSSRRLSNMMMKRNSTMTAARRKRSTWMTPIK